jgi:hypothetical protein
MTERVLRLVSNRRGPVDEDYGWNGSEAETLSADEGWRELRRELDRSRRFGHEFVLMRMPRVADGRGSADLLQSLPARLRSVDSVWGVRRQAYLLLPEADRDVAVALVARLRRESPDLLPEDVRLAAFPTDGLTGGALLELLERRQTPAAAEVPSLDVALHHGLTRA